MLGAVAPFSLLRFEGRAMTALLDEAITALESIEPVGLSDVELHQSVVELTVAESRLAAVRAGLVAAWDARKVWAEDGSKAAWSRLAGEAHLSPKSARRAVRRARALARMPVTAAALREGKLSIDQADLLAHANQLAVAELFARDESMLIGQILMMRAR
jgi:hypothetical protein